MVIDALATDEVAWFEKTKITAFSTWYKYKNIFHSNIYLEKLKEDCCDTCMKYEIFLQNPDISEDDRSKILAARNVRSALFAHYIVFHCYDS